MDRETFEQLVSQSLDQPEREQLRLRVEAAATQSAELARLKEQWLRLDRLVRGRSPAINRVNWPRFHQRVRAAIEEQGRSERFNEALRRATAIERRVDWPRFRERVSQAVARAGGQPPVIRFPLRRVAASVGLVGAAAALALMLAFPAKRPAAGDGFAQLRVSSPRAALESPGGRSAFASVIVAGPAEAHATIVRRQPRPAGPAERQLAEVFLIVGPAPSPRDGRGALIPFGFN